MVGAGMSFIREREVAAVQIVNLWHTFIKNVFFKGKQLVTSRRSMRGGNFLAIRIIWG